MDPHAWEWQKKPSIMCPQSSFSLTAQQYGIQPQDTFCHHQIKSHLWLMLLLMKTSPQEASRILPAQENLC
jgi:hypothetical protein